MGGGCFGVVGPGFHLHDYFEVDVDGIFVAGTRVDTQHFLGIAYPKLVYGNLPAVGKGNCQFLIHHLRIVPDTEFVAPVVNIVRITLLQLQRSTGQME